MPIRLLVRSRSLLLIALTVSATWCCGAGDGKSAERPDAEAPGRFKTSVWTPEFKERIRSLHDRIEWQKPEFTPLLDANTLEASIAKARTFLLDNQYPEGNFHYEYDFVTKRQSRRDNEVRQAGALWGLSLLHIDQPTDRSRAALDKGLDFFIRRSRPAGNDGLVPLYSRSGRTGTGTVALVALAITEYLRKDVEIPEARRRMLTDKLRGYLDFLKAQQFPDGTFSAGYFIASNKRTIERSCYADGEALLAFCKAARYLGRIDLLPRIEAASGTMIKRYVLDALSVDPDPAETKQFYQWGTMSLWECFDAGWSHGEACADTAMIMAWWMIHAHRTLDRTRNTGYAHEGLVHAYRIAAARRHEAAMAELQFVIDRGLRKLMTWQVGGPLAEQNSYLRLHPTKDPLALGGIMNASDEPLLRIDVTQHQSHAMLLALRHVYKDASRPGN